MLLQRWTPRIVRAGLGFVYPPSCLWCFDLLEEKAAAATGFCSRCLPLIDVKNLHRCRRCSAPVGPYLNTEQGCIHCMNDKYSFSGLVSLGAYQDELRAACRKCKQHGQGTLTWAISQLMCHENEQELRSWKPDLVMPVPHHWYDRLWAEHASTSVAEAVGQFLKVPVNGHILRKVRRTKKQAELSGSDRRKNLQEAFRVQRTARLKGLHILLADDILTTGVTANRCTQELLRAGAERVSVAVLARSLGS